MIYTLNLLAFLFFAHAEAGSFYSDHCSSLHEEADRTKQLYFDCLHQNLDLEVSSLVAQCKSKSDLMVKSITDEGICYAKAKRKFEVNN